MDLRKQERTGTRFAGPSKLPAVPERIGETNPEGVDYGWVMQVTFVVTIVVGAPLVALASVFFDLATWTERATFAVRVGALVWFCTAVLVFLYERRQQTE
jgi:hypothetical protein